MTEPWKDLAWADALGRLRVVTVPAANPAPGAGVRIDPADAGLPGVDGPLTLLPDSHACFTSPWDGRTVQLCDLAGPDGAPSPACSRSILRRVLGEAAREGYDVIAAAELECFLLRPDGEPVYATIENYGMAAGAPYEPIMEEVRGLARAGVPVIATNPEYGGGQFEINLRHGPALAAADAVVLLRAWIAAAAAGHGLGVTFSAKPWADGSGSGMHVHQSLWRAGRNLFWSDGELSPLGRSYLAGLLEAMGELAPLGSPTPAAYRRRADGSFCPTMICWGGDNRTVAVRVLAEDEGATRVEQRDAAADANPYLVFAGQIAAGLDGIRRGLTPPPPTEGNAYGRMDLPALPRTLGEAVPRFAASALARQVMGEPVHGIFAERLAAQVDLDLAGLAATSDPDGAW